MNETSHREIKDLLKGVHIAAVHKQDEKREMLHCGNFSSTIESGAVFKRRDGNS